MQGNPVRAAAAMAVADKQSLPIETQVDRTPRGGASYTQRIVVLCPMPPDGWPEDRRSRAEPAVNAWLATMLGDPARYRFVARVHRVDGDGQDVIDADPVVATWDDLGAVAVVGGPAGRGRRGAAARRARRRPAFAASSRRH